MLSKISFCMEKPCQNDRFESKNTSKIIKTLILKGKTLSKLAVWIKKANQKASKRSFWKEKPCQNSHFESTKRIKKHQNAHFERENVVKISILNQKSESKSIKTLTLKGKTLPKLAFWIKKANQKASKRAFWKEKPCHNEHFGSKKWIKKHQNTHFERKNLAKIDKIAKKCVVFYGVWGLGFGAWLWFFRKNLAKCTFPKVNHACGHVAHWSGHEGQFPRSGVQGWWECSENLGRL